MDEISAKFYLAKHISLKMLFIHSIYHFQFRVLFLEFLSAFSNMLCVWAEMPLPTKLSQY